MMPELEALGGATRGRVLVVDDDRDFADSLRNYLTLEGYQVVVAYDAAQAEVEADGFEPQVAILDYRLGPAVGVDLVAPLTRRNSGIVCLLSTAYSNADTAINALRSSIYDYLRKPLDNDALLATLVRCFEKIRLEGERAAAEAALREARRTEAVARVVGGVAHHFNNLLTVIQGSLELLAEELPASGTRRELADSALEATEDATAINRELVAFTRHQILRPESLDLADFFGRINQILAHELGESIGLDVRTGAGIRPVVADRAQLSAALVSLVRNARQAMPRGGGLTVVAANAEETDDRPQKLPAGNYVIIAVSDTGDGMSADIAERAFEPFFSGRGMAEATGLGLSMVYGFARQSGGVATIESAVGEGATVRLYLPAAGD